jgi:hypothetical protein
MLFMYFNILSYWPSHDFTVVFSFQVSIIIIIIIKVYVGISDIKVFRKAKKKVT